MVSISIRFPAPTAVLLSCATRRNPYNWIATILMSFSAHTPLIATPSLSLSSFSLAILPLSLGYISTVWVLTSSKSDLEAGWVDRRQMTRKNMEKTIAELCQPKPIAPTIPTTSSVETNTSSLKPHRTTLLSDQLPNSEITEWARECRVRCTMPSSLAHSQLVYCLRL